MCPPPVPSRSPPLPTHPRPLGHTSARLAAPPTSHHPRREGCTLSRAVVFRPASRPATRTVTRVRTCAPGQPCASPGSGPDTRRPARLAAPHLRVATYQALAPRRRRSPSQRPCPQRPCPARPCPNSPAPGAPNPGARPMGSARRARCQPRRCGAGPLPAACRARGSWTQPAVR